MNALADPFKQLVERKLWPLALLLVAALVAVPLLLTEKPAETSPLPAATTGVPAGQGETESVVSLADANKTDKLRAVLGNRKDPFRPAQFHRVPKDETLTQAGQATVVEPTGSSSGGSSAPSGGTPVAGDTPSTPVETPVPAAPTPAPKTYDLYSLEVRFGPTDGELVSRNVKRLTGLPGGNPALLYLGLMPDHKTAVFLVDAGVNVLGDGECDPSPDNCQTLTLEKGETEFINRGGEQWELDLIDIHVKKTTDARAARKARAAEARNGRKLARRMGARSSAYRYDAGEGTLQRVAKVSRHSRAPRNAAFDTSG
jgi:hypothetical protein